MRPICAGCARPVSVCLCDVIPSPPFNLQTRLLILQHPHELKHKLATVPVLSRCVHPCHVVVGRRLHSSNWPFASSDDTAGHTLLLFPGLDATELQPWYAAVAHGERVDCVKSVEDALPRSVQVCTRNCDKIVIAIFLENDSVRWVMLHSCMTKFFSLTGAQSLRSWHCSSLCGFPRVLEF